MNPVTKKNFSTFRIFLFFGLGFFYRTEKYFTRRGFYAIIYKYYYVLITEGYV